MANNQIATEPSECGRLSEAEITKDLKKTERYIMELEKIVIYYLKGIFEPKPTGAQQTGLPTPVSQTPALQIPGHHDSGTDNPSYQNQT